MIWSKVGDTYADKTFCTLKKKRVDRRISGVRFVRRSRYPWCSLFSSRFILVSSFFSFWLARISGRSGLNRSRMLEKERQRTGGRKRKKAKESERKRKKGEERLHKRMSSIGLSRRDAFPIASSATRRRENLDSRLPYPSLARKLVVLKRLKDNRFYPRGRHFPLIRMKLFRFCLWSNVTMRWSSCFL